MCRHSLTLDDTVQQYLPERGVREHPEQAALREATRKPLHANMQIGPEQGQLLQLLVKFIGARRTIEIGTFTGYSALTVALGLLAGGFWRAIPVTSIRRLASLAGSASVSATMPGRADKTRGMGWQPGREARAQQA